MTTGQIVLVAIAGIGIYLTIWRFIARAMQQRGIVMQVESDPGRPPNDLMPFEQGAVYGFWFLLGIGIIGGIIYGIVTAIQGKW